MRALVLFAHGSRDAQWAEPIRRVQALVERAPDAPRVSVAFLEFMTPDLASSVRAAVAEGASVVRVAPLFLGQGGHLRRDLGALVDTIRTEHPHVVIEVAPPLGEAPEVLAAIAAWALDSRGRD
jgi:sirohydrochlorin cobaltochelatase